MNFNEDDQLSIRHFLQEVSRSNIHGLSSEDELWNITDSETKVLINNILALDPKKYGFKGKQLLKEAVPKDAVMITDQTQNASGEYKLLNSTYLPRNVFAAFTAMGEAFAKENPGRKLLVGSGYRSPAFQIVTLLYILAKIYDFDLEQTLTRVAMPPYSQHCLANHTAIDMLNIDGEPSDEEPQEFSKSIEYAWLLKNAQRFNFYESYPPNNPDGIMWEPWHWQFLG